MISIRIPRDPTVATKFFGQFTAKDLGRIGVPVIVAYVAATYLGLNTVAAVLVGVVAGVSIYRWRPYGKTIDQLLVDAVIWRWNVYNSSFETVNRVSFQDRSIVTKTQRNGTTTAYMLIEPVNLSLQTETEQAALHSRVQRLLETVSYPVKFHVIQHDANLNYDKITDFDDEINEDLDHVIQSFEEYVKSNLGETIEIDLPIVSIPVEQPNRSFWQTVLPWRTVNSEDSLAEQIDTVEHRVEEVLDTLNTSMLEVGALEGDDLELLFDVDAFKTRPTLTFTDSGGEYAKTVVIEGYPSTVDLCWPTTLLDCDGNIEISQVVEPADTSDVVSDLNASLEKLSAEIGSWLQAGYLGTTDLEARLNDAEWMLSQFTDRVDKPVKYKSYVTALGSTREECEQTYDELTSKLDMMQFDYRQPVLETHRVRDAVSIAMTTHTADTDVMPSSSAAAGVPIGVRPKPETDGVIVGTDARDGSPVFLHRFGWKAPHMVRLGATGSGKSYATQLELLRSAVTHDDADCIVIDPKKEYDTLIEELGGKVYELTENHTPDDVAKGLKMTEPRFTAIQPEERVGDHTNNLLVDIVRGVYRATTDDSSKTIVVIDESHRLLNHSTEGKQLLSTFVREARDTKTGITLISQNASDFTSTKEGRALLDNVETTVLMQHERVPDSMIDYFNLSQQEVQELHSLKTGTDWTYSEAVVKVSNRRNAKIKVKASDQEHAIIAGGSDDA